MDLYTDFLILLYRHLYKYKLLNYNNLSLNEKVIWPKWIGVDIKIKLIEIPYNKTPNILKGWLYKDNNNILHSVLTIIIYVNNTVSLFDTLNQLVFDLYICYNKPIKYTKDCPERASTFPEINEFSDCKMSYDMFFNKIGQYYKQCCALRGDACAERDLYEIFFEFNKKYRSLLIIKEYLKSHNYKKNYHEILAAKDGLQIIKFEKQIFRSMYNSIIKNKNTNNFNFCSEEAVSNGRCKKEKYHLHYSHWISTIFY